MSLASKVMGNEKAQALSKAYDVANEIMNNSSSPIEALKKANVSNDTLQRLRGYLDNPTASFVLKPLGLDVAQTKAMLDQLGMGVNPPVQETQTGGDLQSLQNTLAKLGKK